MVWLHMCKVYNCKPLSSQHYKYAAASAVIAANTFAAIADSAAAGASATPTTATAAAAGTIVATQFNSIQLFYPSSGTSPQSPPPIQQGQVGMMGHCRQGPTCYRGHHSPLQQDTLTKPEANPLNPLGHCGGHSKRGLPRSHKTHKKANKSSRKTNQRRAGATGRSKVGTVSYHQALCS